jgi:hypothetical protein
MSSFGHPLSDVSAQSARLPHSNVVPGRACGTCTLCCKVAAVDEVSKQMGVWCPHCLRHGGCAIYDSRPPSCRAFHCQWMVEQGLGPEWKPDRAKFALTKTEAGRRLTVLVDPGYPSAWRRSPYYENLKHWAEIGASRSPDLHFVDVMIGTRCIVILPDRDVEIGPLGPDEMIQVECRMTATGAVIEVQKAKRQ